jgi:hypothetical protein
MIDKLEIRIPAGTQFTSEVESIFHTIHGRHSRHYLQALDLRPFGYSAILHYGCLHGRRSTPEQPGPRGNHKVELIDTHLLSYAEILDEIEYVFHIQTEPLSIMRLDLAVDIEGIGVRWFRENTRVSRKQWLANLGVMATAEMGKNEPQTLYYGRRPNLIRIYNKVEECRQQYRRLVRETARNLVPPSFEECYGIPETGKIVTRIERQMGGGRIPSVLETVGQLSTCADFNPFGGIEFVGGGCPEPNPANYSFMELCTGMYLRHLAQTEGMQAMLAFVAHHSNRNRAWARKKFKDFLPVSGKNTLNEDRLFQLFRESTRAQLNGLNPLANPLNPDRMVYPF